MQDFKKINNISGWIIFIISTIVYVLTVEQTASYWDCGEFIAVSYKLEVPHPPGAPLFLLIGRLFSFLALGDVTQVAFWINMVSVLSSSFTILFLFWTIVLLGRKLLKIKLGEETTSQTWSLMSAAAIGSLAYTFSDSFWFSAVEAEVYAMSSFFMAFAFWAILKWELIEDESESNRWLVLLAYVIGLSIGVHLLNLVTLPAMGLIYYFKKYQPSKSGILATLIVSLGIILIIMVGIIPGLPSIAGALEIFFVNAIGLPFGSGIIFFIVIFLGVLVFGIMYSIKRGKVLLNTALLCFTFIIIGYSSYALVVIRSGYNPPIDENNPENIISVVSYLKREQYGYRPLLRGQYYTAELVDQKRGAPVYVKDNDKYKISDYKIVNVYDPEQIVLFPRIYSGSAEHKKIYQEKLGLKPGEKPSYIDNIKFLFSHQLGHMYMRYFMWNFAGRESDIQNAGWLTPVDALKSVPEAIKENKGRNNFLMLPLILGLIGLFLQFTRDKKGFSVTASLFFLTGMALILYLNSPPIEPRERDYIYVGSFYAFAIWIGFGTLAMIDLLNQKFKNAKINTIIATLICLFIPGIMAVEGWDDHDRSNRYFSVDSAKNFLASCAPNAILFTGGDNDTFPLWYVQEVEGFRTDVRVVVLSYFNTDWYIDQMTRDAYESKAFPFSLTEKNYRQGTNDYLPLVENPNLKGAMDVKQYLKLIKEEHPLLAVQSQLSDKLNTVPTRRMSLSVNKDHVRSLGIIPSDMDSLVQDRMTWNLKGGGLDKGSLMLLDIIVSNNWERPIYFNNTSLNQIGVNLQDYVVREGNTYRLLPVKNSDPNIELVNTEVMYDNVMNKFHWRELNNPNTYYSEDYRNFALSHRSSLNALAQALIQKGETEKAGEVLRKSIELIPDEAIPFDYSNGQSVKLYLTIGENELAEQVANRLVERADQVLTYYEENNMGFDYEVQKNLVILNDLTNAFKGARQNEMAQKIENIFIRHYAYFDN
ncbi:DUF2723 domain-containing protein [Fulvivirgaceae bacterium BMA10]|uniref:DUF2723 domain-containing protein n=1 Tax=Splendidivirga corallicola TaxID=3051826 RepID=A0ABT8KJB8_9BACT|nr:DUF2723 domain-containing protein [Fulvivirgaceae bacterium BMA10]